MLCYFCKQGTDSYTVNYSIPEDKPCLQPVIIEAGRLEAILFGVPAQHGIEEAFTFRSLHNVPVLTPDPSGNAAFTQAAHQLGSEQPKKSAADEESITVQSTTKDIEDHLSETSLENHKDSFLNDLPDDNGIDDFSDLQDVPDSDMDVNFDEGNKENRLFFPIANTGFVSATEKAAYDVAMEDVQALFLRMCTFQL